MTDTYPPDWRQRAATVYERDGYTCQNCGAQGGPLGDAELHAHHIVDVSSGGSHAPSNLVTLCQECHIATHNPGINAPTAVDERRYANRETRPARSSGTWSERNGRWWIHALLLPVTLGMGNAVYWGWVRWRSRNRRQAHPPGTQSDGGVVRWTARAAGVLVVLLLVVLSTLVAVAGIIYAGLAVAQNRHGAYDWIQGTEFSRLPGLDRDEPDWRAGVATVGYLLLVLVSLRLLLV